MSTYVSKCWNLLRIKDGICSTYSVNCVWPMTETYYHLWHALICLEGFSVAWLYRLCCGLAGNNLLLHMPRRPWPWRLNATFALLCLFTCLLLQKGVGAQGINCIPCDALNNAISSDLPVITWAFNELVIGVIWVLFFDFCLGGTLVIRLASWIKDNKRTLFRCFVSGVFLPCFGT